MWYCGDMCEIMVCVEDDVCVGVELRVGLCVCVKVVRTSLSAAPVAQLARAVVL